MYRSVDAASLSAQQWDAFVAQHPHAHVLQTIAWGKLKSCVGWRYQPVAITADDQLAAGALLLFRRLPWGQTVAYAPKGPLVDWEDVQQVQALHRAVEDVCRRHRAALLKLEPDLPDEATHRERLQQAGFTSSTQTVQPRSTIVLDISVPEDEILAQMKSKWRYNIRLAARKGVKVRRGTAEDLTIFQNLIEHTSQRNEFGVRSPEYYRAAYELFCAPGVAELLIAEYEGRPLAAIVPFELAGRAYYMWGASSDEERQRMPNHALQWAAIQWARQRGARTYDLWGIPDEVGQDPEAYADTDSIPPGKGGLWGVYRFKQGFGGQVVRYVGAWDRPSSLPGYWLYRVGLRVRGLAAQHGD